MMHVTQDDRDRSDDAVAVLAGTSETAPETDAVAELPNALKGRPVRRRMTGSIYQGGCANNPLQWSGPDRSPHGN